MYNNEPMSNSLYYYLILMLLHIANFIDDCKSHHAPNMPYLLLISACCVY